MKTILTLILLSLMFFITPVKAAPITIQVLPKGEILVGDWDIEVNFPHNEKVIELSKANPTIKADTNPTDPTSSFDKAEVKNIKVTADVYMDPKNRGQYQTLKCEISRSGAANSTNPSMTIILNRNYCDAKIKL